MDTKLIYKITAKKQYTTTKHNWNYQYCKFYLPIVEVSLLFFCIQLNHTIIGAKRTNTSSLKEGLLFLFAE
jgi:hypothetical protein